MEEKIIDEAKARYERQSMWMKVLLVLVAVAIVGTVVCVILAILRVAVQAVVITAGVLVLAGVIGAVLFNGLKYKMQASDYKHQLAREQRENSLT